MAKSRARFLSELLGTTGLVKKSKSALAGADEVIDLSTLPSIPNSKLTNSSITINSSATSLGGSVTLTTANVAENTNLYYTDARADARIAAADTGDLSEGSNLYYTDARADARVNLQTGSNLNLSSKNTGDLSEGSNLYYTNARADARIAAADTGDLSEGSNLYYTNARADARIAAASTSDLSEGTNLYYTDARADARVALIVDSAPGTLNTLNELAAALGDDANFSTTVTNSIATKLPLAGGTLTGNLAGTTATFTTVLDASLTVVSSDAITGIGFTDPSSSGYIHYVGSAGQFYTTRAFAVNGATLASGMEFQVNGDSNFTGSITGTGLNLTDSNAPYITFTEGSNVVNMGLDGGSFWIRQNGLSGGDELKINADGTLNVNHDATFAGTISSGAITSSGNITAGNSGNINIPTASSGNANMSFDGSNFTIVSNSSSANLRLQTNSQDTLTIAANGNITHHRGNANLGTISSGHHTISTTGTGNGLFVNGGGNTGQIKVGDYTRITGATTSNAGAFSFNANHQGAQLSTWVPDYAGSASAGMFVLRQDGGGQGSTSVWVKNSGTTSTAQNLTTFTKVAQFHQDGYFSTPAGLRVGSTEVISSGRAITATSVGVTNIVTNKVVKFDGTVLNDSNITDTGSLITLGSNTTVSGKIIAGDATSTNGDVLLEGYYGNGATVVIGSERSSGGVFLGYGVQPSTTTQHQFLSSTPANLTQSAYVAADTHRWWTASSGSAVALGSQVTTMAQRMTILANGNVGIGVDSPGNKLQVAAGNAQIQAWFGDDSYTHAAVRVGGANAAGGRLYFQYNGDSSYIDCYGGHGSTQRYRDLYIRGRNTKIHGENGAGILVATSGDVGIGTTGTPISQLEVGDLESGGTGITISARYDQSAAKLTFRTGHPNNTLVWNTSQIVSTDDSNYNGRLEFRTSNSSRANPTTKMTIKSSGNVGIGTPTPDALLDLEKTASGTSFVPLLQLGQTYTVADSKYGIHFKNTTHGWNQGRISVERQGSAANFDMVLSSAGGGNLVEGIRIDHTGNVTTGAITSTGLNSTSGTVQYTDASSAFDSSDADGYARFTHTNGSAQIGLFRAGNSAGGSYIGADDSKLLRVYNTSFASKFDIDTSGNVTALGTISSGALATTGNSTHGGYSSWTAGNGTSGIFQHYNSSNSYRGYFDWRTLQLGNNGANNILAGNTSTGGYFKFWVNATGISQTGGTSGINALTISAAGNSTFSGSIDSGAISSAGRVTVTTSGADGLSLAPDTGSTNNSARLFLNGSSGNWAIFNNSNILKFNSSATVGSTSGNQAASLTTAGLLTVVSLTESSSIRYKENLKPITNGLEVINKLEPVTYDRTDNDSKDEPGFIAEEVLKFLPNVVNHNEEGEVESIKYTKIIAYLVDAVQELSAEVEKLKNG
jgi:hypothetical protein